MPVDDPQQFDRRLQRERDRLAASSSVHPEDKEALERWLKRKDGSVATSSLESYLRRIRLASERGAVPLVEMDEDDFHSLVFDLRHDHELADSTIQSYENALLLFIDDMTEVDWPDEVDRTSPEHSTVDPDTVLTPADIQSLTAAARHQRDVAFIEFLADTGVRVSMALSLRIKDIDLTRPATYTPNADAAGLKGAAITEFPLIDSAGAIRSYLRTSHPRPNDPEVALFHKLHPSSHENGDSGRWNDDGSLVPNGIRKQIKRVADRAGIDKPTNPHAFRHAAITRMVREGYSRSQIEHRVHWTLDTDMWEIYEHITGTEHTEDIFREADIIEGDDSPEKVRKSCGNCGEPLAPHHDWCGNCGEPVSPGAAETVEEGEETILERIVDEANPTTREELKQLLEDVQSDREITRAHEDPS